MSGAEADRQKAAWPQSSRRTRASASEKVGRALGYHAAWRTTSPGGPMRGCAQSVTSEKSPSKAGVVRRIARSDHWRWRLDAEVPPDLLEVTSSCQRSTNQARICAGSAARSVQSSACVANRPAGSRISTQRMRHGRQAACGTTPPCRRRPPPCAPPPRTSWRRRRASRRSPGRRCAPPGSAGGCPSRAGGRSAPVGGAGPGAYERGVEAQPGDDGDRVGQPRAARQQRDGRVAAVGDDHDGARGAASAAAAAALPRPVGQLLVPPVGLPVVPLGRGEDGQERQRPGPPGPGDAAPAAAGSASAAR